MRPSSREGVGEWTKSNPPDSTIRKCFRQCLGSPLLQQLIESGNLVDAWKDGEMSSVTARTELTTSANPFNGSKIHFDAVRGVCHAYNEVGDFERRVLYPPRKCSTPAAVGPRIAAIPHGCSIHSCARRARVHCVSHSSQRLEKSWRAPQSVSLAAAKLLPTLEFLGDAEDVHRGSTAGGVAKPAPGCKWLPTSLRRVYLG